MHGSNVLVLIELVHYE